MAKKDGKKLTGRNFALTILLGVFIAIMVVSLFNLIVEYAYESPKYDDYCRGVESMGPYPVKYGVSNEVCGNCTFSPALQQVTEQCYNDNGIPVYNYDDKGCTASLKECNMCSKTFEGFALIVSGLFIHILLIQIITLPAGAFLVIEAAVQNFDDKLLVIITFSLLIIAAVLLALKKLK
jgi:hypothetical protein